MSLCISWAPSACTEQAHWKTGGERDCIVRDLFLSPSFSYRSLATRGDVGPRI